MRIEASRFTDLPTGCPVRWGGDPAVVVSRHGATEYQVMVGPRRDFPAVAAESQLSVDLSAPGTARAFAPELITAVRGLPDHARPEKEPAAVWYAGMAAWVLVDHVNDRDEVVRRQPGLRMVTGSTPAECLANGLKAALDAAKDAQ